MRIVYSHNVSMLALNGKLTFVAFQRVCSSPLCLFNLYTEIVLFVFPVVVVVDIVAFNVSYAADVYYHICPI